jgi:cysteinyl-tRNA synthetase, unknown class
MKKILYLCIACSFFIACGGDDNDDDNNDDDVVSGLDYKNEMRKFVQEISQYTKGISANFIIIPQNGQEIVTQYGDIGEDPVTSYLNAIDGVGREDLFFGYDDDDEATSTSDKLYMMDYLDICEENNVEVLVTDYCWTESKMDDSYAQNAAKNYISFAAPDRELNVIPEYPETIYNENAENITSLTDAKNFLYLLNPENFTTKQAFIDAINATNYDVIIMDYFFEDDAFTNAEITAMKLKNNGGSRLIISYMSIGEAEDYRYYWQDAWNSAQPEWIEVENPDWEGNYKVKYWNDDWKAIIYGNNDSYVKKILDAGFDGVYLDIIDAFEYFE